MPARPLSLLDATLLVMGGIIGVGIFFTPRLVAQQVPEPAAFLSIWAIGGLIALTGALTFAELGATFPKSGGWYVFLHEAFGPFLSFLFAWVVLGVISSGAVAVMARVFVDNVPGLPAGAGVALGAGAIVGVSGLAMLGVKAGATLQNVCMLVKLLAIAAMAIAGLLFFHPSTTAVGAAAAPPLPAGGLLRGMISAILPVLFACGGWQMLCYVAPQVKDPQRTLPRAIVLGILGVIVTYLAINAAYVRVLGIDGIANDPRFAGEMARRTLGDRGGELLGWAMAISALGVCVVTIVATPWLYVAMAREGLFFARFGRVSARTGAPVAALCVQAVLCLSYWFWGRADALVNSVVFVEWIFHAAVALALLRMRALRPELPRPFRSPLYPLAPALYLAFALAVVVGNLVTTDATSARIGLAVLGAGALAYRPWRKLVAA